MISAGNDQLAVVTAWCTRVGLIKSVVFAIAIPFVRPSVTVYCIETAWHIANLCHHPTATPR